MDYVDPSIAIRKFCKLAFTDEFKSFKTNKLNTSDPLPALMVRATGKTTLQLLVRSEDEIEAVDLCTLLANFLCRNHASIDDVNVFDISLQTPVWADVDEETKKPEGWCYLNINYFEN